MERRAEAVPARPLLQTRSLSLDVLRAIAVLLVIASHSPVTWMTAAGVPWRLARALRCGGWIGVDLFFVLSGFLIAGLLFREYRNHGHLKLGTFLLRRAFKIYPPFYVLLAATIVHQAVVQGRWHRGTIVEALFLQSYFGSIWGHTWSLAVEEHFYLLLPLLMVFLARRHSGRAFLAIPRICLGIALVVLGLRLVTALAMPYRPLTHLYATHLRIDGLMFGVFLAYAYHFRREPFLRAGRRYYWLLLAVGSALLMPAFLLPLGETPYVHTFGLTQFYLGSGCLLVALVARPVAANRFTRGLGYVGAYSYSIYLWHLPLRAWSWKLGNDVLGVPLDQYPWVAFIGFVGGSLAAGIALAKLIEVPVLRLRDRLVPSRSVGLQEGLREIEVQPAQRPLYGEGSPDARTIAPEHRSPARASLRLEARAETQSTRRSLRSGG